MRRRPSMPLDLRERFGSVIPMWELHVPIEPRDGGPDTEEAIKARRDVLVRTLWHEPVDRPGK